MRLTISRTELIKGLGMVAKAIPNKTALPILVNVKMTLNEKGLVLLASDNDFIIQTIVPYMIEDKQIITNSKPGSTLVNYKYFSEVIRRLEGENVTLEVIDSIILRIDDGKSNFKLNCINPDEYPDINLDMIGNIFDMKTSDLVDLVESTSFAASTKEGRPVLTAINFEARENVLTTTATDTARLARKRIDLDSNVTFSVNILAKKFVDIVHSFENEEMVTIAVSDKKAIFAFGFTTISIRLINIDYPNTRNIVPKSFNYTLEVSAKEFLSAMDRVAILSSEHDGVVKLVMSEDEVEIMSRSLSVGSANEKINTCMFNGERLEVSFKSAFVSDAIKALKCEDITIAFVGEMKPFVVKNVKDSSVDMLITPLRAQ